MKLAVKEKLACGKIRMNDTFAVYKHYGFYDLSGKLNAAFIGYVLVALQIALNVSMWRVFKIHKEIPLGEALYSPWMITEVIVDLAFSLDRYHSERKIVGIRSRNFSNASSIETVNVGENADPDEVVLVQIHVGHPRIFAKGSRTLRFVFERSAITRRWDSSQVESPS